MKRTRGSLLALAALPSLLLAAAPIAAGNIVLDRELPADVRGAAARYEVNEKLGRAWVVVTYHHDDGFESGVWDSEERVLVPGLSYDAARREVRLREGAKDVVCAVRKKGFFGTKYLEVPGCMLRLRSEPRTVDDGFTRSPGVGVVVELLTQNR